MPLPTSGTLSLLDLQNQFGGSNPIGLNEYYAGGGLVPAGTVGSNSNSTSFTQWYSQGLSPSAVTIGAIPSSGQINLSQFYGAPLLTTLGTFTTDNTYVLTQARQSIGPDFASYHGFPNESYSPPYSVLMGTSGGNDWLYDESGANNLVDAQAFYTPFSFYFIGSNVNTITIQAWGGGGGSGGAWANSGNSPGGAGGYATTTLSRSSGHFTTGQWLFALPGHAGRGGEDFVYSGTGGGASFAWFSSVNPTGQSPQFSINATRINTSSLILCAGGGGGGGASNVFSGGGTGYGGGGGTRHSGDNNTGQVSGFHAGGGSAEWGTIGHGTQSLGPYSELSAGAAGGTVGYYSGSLTQLPEGHPRNLMITSTQEIVLAGQQFSAKYTFSGGPGGGVFGGASGSGSMGGSYGYSSRGAGGGASKIYKGSGSTSYSGAYNTTPPNSGQSGGKGYGGSGSYGNNGSTYPNKSGNNGTPGRVIVTLS